MDRSANRLTCFKAYDVRGRVPDDLDENIARRIARAFAAFLGARRVAVGHDIRLSSPALAAAVTEGLVAAGVEVIDVGRCGTEQVYFATAHLGLDGGIMVTASHNPAEYNGLKLVREGGRPISADTGLLDIEERVRHDRYPPGGARGCVRTVDLLPDYVAHLLGYVDPRNIRPWRVVVNAGNGGAGAVLDALEPHLPCTFVKVNHAPDGTFPQGVPNPILPANRRATAEAVQREAADLGIAWDGDFDRCFFFDGQGRFVEGCYVVSLLAGRALARHPGATIVHDPRVVWGTIEVVMRAGGRPVQSKGGHAFMKETMRRVDAVYGGENPGHHFFREFSYCDSGMIPWLLLLEHLGLSGRSLDAQVDELARAFPTSGEINLRLDDPAGALARVTAHYVDDALRIDREDGVSMEFDRWRFNLRASNTEPLVRLNVEARRDAALVADRVQEILRVLGATPADDHAG